MAQYDVSIDPYENGARVHYMVRATNKREAVRAARMLAERDGWMSAAWRQVEVTRQEAS